MNNRQSMHYKAKNPVETVEYIIGILKEYGIEVEEDWQEESFANTFSLRLTVKGTNIGTNGKGMTREYARASAYAEFMERLQNNLLSIYPRTRQSENDVYYSHDEKIMNIQSVIADNNTFIGKLFHDRNMDDATMEEKENLIMRLHKAEYMLTKNKEDFIGVPFYSLKDKKQYYLPYNLYASMYGSNGMCSGNTPKEAVIQGLSEIVERYIQRRIIEDDICLPDIPLSYIEGFPEINERYNKLQNIDGFQFQLKDCSLGGRYPVAALLVLEENSGYYGIKLGCHPDYGIAMERALTEAAQGGEITKYSRRSKFDFTDTFVKTEVNVTNTYKTGRGQYPYVFFSDSPSYDFVPFKDVSVLTDDELLEFMIHEVVGDEYDILVRDVSNMNFPSYHIIIPNMSEMASGNDKGFDLVASMTLSEYLINHPDEIDEKSCNVLLYVLYSVSRMDLNSSISVLSGTLLHKELLPGEEYNLGWLYMIVMCYIFQNNYEKAKEKMDLFEEITLGRGYHISSFYTAINYYLSGMLTFHNHNFVMKYLRKLYSMEICDKIDDRFRVPKDIFKKNYIHHNISDKKTCDCNKCCDYQLYQGLIKLARISQIKNPIKQEHMEATLLA